MVSHASWPCQEYLQNLHMLWNVNSKLRSLKTHAYLTINNSYGLSYQQTRLSKVKSMFLDRKGWGISNQKVFGINILGPNLCGHYQSQMWRRLQDTTAIRNHFKIIVISICLRCVIAIAEHSKIWSNIRASELIPAVNYFTLIQVHSTLGF